MILTLNLTASLIQLIYVSIQFQSIVDIPLGEKEQPILFQCATKSSKEKHKIKTVTQVLQRQGNY